MALASVGTVLQRSDDNSSASSYTAVGEVNSITGPNMSRDFIDTTSLDTTGGYKTFIGSFRDPGELQLEMNFDRDEYLTMLAEFQAAAAAYWQIVLPDSGNTTFEFAGFVSAIGAAFPKEDKITCSITIKITGQVTVSS